MYARHVCKTCMEYRGEERYVILAEQHHDNGTYENQGIDDEKAHAGCPNT